MQNKKIHIIGGTGQMGSWLKKFLEEQNIAVTVSGKKHSNTEAIKQSDITIFSVPIEQVATVIRETVANTKKEAILIDLSSVMTHGQKEMKNSGHTAASLHFLFGPTISDITNQHIVFSPMLNKEDFSDVLSLFIKKGAQISEMSAENHDKVMAHIQALTHFSNLALAETLLDNNIGLTPEITTPTFLNQIAVITRVLLNNSAELLTNIQINNPAFVEVLTKHIANQSRWLSAISAGKPEALQRSYEHLQKQITPHQTEEKETSITTKKEIVLPADASIAYLGPKGTFSHQAAITIQPDGILLPEETFYDIFTAVAGGKATFGIIPAENSIEGTIRETLDYLVEFDVETKCSYTLPVSHCLLSDEKEMSVITRVFSHPQALAQSRKWLQKHLPSVNIFPAKSTISEVTTERAIPGTAYIGSQIAAQAYSLNVLATNIEEMKDNVTKFYIIGKKENKLDVATNRTILFLSIFNRVGILKDILSVFASFNINLNKIESRPSHEKVWDYYFFVEVEIARNDSRMTQVLSMLKLFCPEIKILGEL